MPLIDETGSASGINELESVSACDDLNIHFVYDHVCRLYFELLEGDQVKLLHFVFGN